MITIDTETGGFDAFRCGLCEVAGLFWSNGPDGPEPVDSFQSLVRYNPALQYDEEAMQAHGITLEMLFEAPPEKEVLEKYFEFLSIAREVCGSNPSFDKRFIEAAAKRHGMSAPNLAYRSVNDLFKKKTGEKTASLSHMARYYGVEALNAHRAMADCETVARVVWCIETDAPKADLGETLRAPKAEPEPLKYGGGFLPSSRPSTRRPGFRRF